MPRLNLTDEEAKLILRQREINDAHRAGWNKALDYAISLWEEGNLTHNEFLAKLKEAKRG